MGDPGFISGFAILGIELILKELIRYITDARCCRKKLQSLVDLINRIEHLNHTIQQCRMNSTITSGEDGTSSAAAIDKWAKDLDIHLQVAGEIVSRCTVPKRNVVARYRMSKKISDVIENIEAHLRVAPLVAVTNQFSQMRTRRRRVEAVDYPDLGTTGAAAAHPTQRAQQFLQEPRILGQDTVFEKLEGLLIDGEERGLTACIGVQGMGGSGKTLLLKRVHNSKKVQDHFVNDLVVWLTVSQAPSIGTLLNSLGKQISDQITENFGQQSEEDSQRWIQQKMTGRRFVMFLDDVWEGSEDLLQRLGVPVFESNGSKIIVSTREKRVLPRMGVKESHTISMNVLSEDDSWDLFCTHAFANKVDLKPSRNIEDVAKRVCSECGKLPLALKVIGAAMAGITDRVEWDVTLQRLENADKFNPNVEKRLYDRLRLSYFSLGDYDSILQLCFLYLGAFKEDEEIEVEQLIKVWIGEGFLIGNKPDAGYDPFEIGRINVNLLVDRCLIEPRQTNELGQVTACSVHDVLHDLARRIAENEENCFFRAGKGLETFRVDDCRNRSRISLMNNNFSRIPDAFEGSKVRALLLNHNESLTNVPATVIGSLASITVLDLSGTSLQSLPETFGCLKRLVCLRLARLPIKKLPESVTGLRRLQVLDLRGCRSLRQLPFDLDKLISLTYLDISWCHKLQSIPCGISRLTSLQCLRMTFCEQAWDERPQTSPWGKVSLKGKQRKPACLNDLHTLQQLRCLEVHNNEEESIREGMLDSMKQMRDLVLRLSKIKILPDDMNAMSELRTLHLSCISLVGIPHCVCEFQNLAHVKLWECYSLEELPALQKLQRLRQLDIGYCYNLKKLPAEFGEDGGFLSLVSFSLTELSELEELPELEDGAMPSLETLNVEFCEKVKMLPPGFLNLKTLKILTIIDCPLVYGGMEDENWERVRRLEEENGTVVKIT